MIAFCSFCANYKVSALQTLIKGQNGRRGDRTIMAGHTVARNAGLPTHSVPLGGRPDTALLAYYSGFVDLARSKELIVDVGCMAEHAVEKG